MNAAQAFVLIAVLAGQMEFLNRLNESPPQPPLLVGGSFNDIRYFRSGTLTGVLRADRIDFQIGTDKYRLDLKRLPVYENDCLKGPEQCSAQKRTFCGACIVSIDGVAWDERRRRVFLGIAVDTSKNKPWILAGYDFRTNQVTRFGEFYGGGAGLVAFSPSGRYLAMQSFGVCGVCCTSSGMMVADLFEHRIGAGRSLKSSASPDVLEPVSIKTIRWVSETELAYDAESYKEDECRASGSFATRKLTGSIKLSDINFR